MTRTIVHVAEVEPTEDTGMGRISFQWRRECERRGHRFVHIGPALAGHVPHKGFFPRAAWRAWLRLGLEADLFLVHEPCGGAFAGRGLPTVVFSHGIERRGWELTLAAARSGGRPPRWRTRLCFPLWRLRPCDTGLRRATAALLSNREDAAFARERYSLGPERSRVFRNGADVSGCDDTAAPADGCRVLFLGTWIERKGIGTLAEAARLLHSRGVRLEWLLAGTGVPADVVLNGWPTGLREVTEVIPRFGRRDEAALFARSHLFVLPSFFEGQPLALLQAMETGRCCVASDCCGQRDLIQHGFNGLLHPPGDAEALAELLAQCAGDAALRQRLGHNARQSMAGRDWRAVSAEVVDYLESVMNSAPGADGRSHG